ncbi:MAG: hypothetical protein J5851_06030 [Oscillospiraceae bacterium]|nr:hypothetical protein [Oscillospiraceae bacterium]
MRTLAELLTETVRSEELKNQMMAIKSRDDLAAFLQDNECETTIDELETFYQNAIGDADEGEITDAEAENVTGGANYRTYTAAILDFWFDCGDEVQAGLDDADSAISTFFTKTLVDAFSFGPTGPSSCCGQFSTQATKYKVKEIL